MTLEGLYSFFKWVENLMWCNQRCSFKDINKDKRLQHHLQLFTTDRITSVTKRIHPPSHTMHRPPIISIMGHVDHGKTTLLDHLRHSRITQSEAGGITQRLGAFTLTHHQSIIMTILDTPPHEAFMKIRWRASHSTDIIVLVIAIEDGVMPQTRECIQLAEESRVPLVVAINKIDKLLRDEGEWRDLEGVKDGKLFMTR